MAMILSAPPAESLAPRRRFGRGVGPPQITETCEPIVGTDQRHTRFDGDRRKKGVRQVVTSKAMVATETNEAGPLSSGFGC